MTRIDELRNTLEGSAILASKQHRLKALLDDIAKYRYHEQAILRRMAEAVGETEISFTLKQGLRRTSFTGTISKPSSVS